MSHFSPRDSVIVRSVWQHLLLALNITGDYGWAGSLRRYSCLCSIPEKGAQTLHLTLPETPGELIKEQGPEANPIGAESVDMV